MKDLTPEMINKAKTVKSAEELLEIAKRDGVELTVEEATAYFAQLNPKNGELDEDELDAVAGGCNGIIENPDEGVQMVTSSQCCANFECVSCHGTHNGVRKCSGCGVYTQCEGCVYFEASSMGGLCHYSSIIE